MPNRNVVGDYRYNYQGQELDKETGKVAFQLRLYDPRINRWMSPDPKGEFHSPYLSMGNNWIRTIDPDGGSTDDVIYLDTDGNEIHRVAMDGPDIYLQETYAGGIQNGLNVGTFERINLTETFASFDAQRSPGRFRVDGALSLMQTFDNGLTRTLDSWSALSGSRRLLPVPNGND